MKITKCNICKKEFEPGDRPGHVYTQRVPTIGIHKGRSIDHGDVPQYDVVFNITPTDSSTACDFDLCPECRLKLVKEAIKEYAKEHDLKEAT